MAQGSGKNPTLALIVLALVVIIGLAAYLGWRGSYRTPSGSVVPSSTAPGTVSNAPHGS